MKTRLKYLKNRILLLILLYTVLRILFLAFNFYQYGKFSPEDILLSFLYGLRFDLSSIFLLNTPIVLWSLLPKKVVGDRLFNFVNHWLFLGLNLPFIMANLVDFEYYKFTGSRLTSDIFIVRGEAAAQLDQFIINFWHIGALFLFIAFTLHWLTRRWKSPDTLPLGLARGFIFGFVLIALTVLAVRGGLQKKVIQPTHAYKLGHTELGTLTLNSTFTLLKSGFKPQLTQLSYFKTKAETVEHIPQPKVGNSQSIKKENVVVIILESFATEFWGAANEYKGYTPFLDSLAKKSLFFKNNFADGRRSIEALPSVLFGVPSLMSTPISKSKYQQNRWTGVGHTLKESGFHTSFFHGAVTGTMYFDAISAQAGLEDYYPLERYPGKDDFDGNWGVYDEPFLQYMVSELGQHPQPFFSVAFTISTHQPYQVPTKYKGKFPVGPLQVHESVGYVDYAVQRFFEAAEKEEWFDNTLFIITGDHTQMSASEFYNTALGGFMVPLLIYHPKKDLGPINTNKVTHHSDILPSILDYLNISSEKLLLFGRSVFDEDNPGEALLHLNGNFWLVKNDYFLQYNPATEESHLYNYQTDLEQKFPLTNLPDIKSKYLNSTRAYLQYFNNGLIENNLYEWTKAYR